MGVPLVIIHFRLGFSLINHPASLGYCTPNDYMETPQLSSSKQLSGSSASTTIRFPAFGSLGEPWDLGLNPGGRPIGYPVEETDPTWPICTC